MKISKLKELLESASENAEITVEDGDIVVTEPVTFKYPVGSKVTCVAYGTSEVTARIERGGEPWYRLKYVGIVREDDLKPAPADITEHIKTFEDACEWCNNNDQENLVAAYNGMYQLFHDMADMREVLAYLQLRVITAALNEGDTADARDHRFYAYVHDSGAVRVDDRYCSPYTWLNEPGDLWFKSYRLARYAAIQFSDIYRDFCGHGKD